MILCAGESLIDMVEQDGLFRPLPGGSVYNTALALGRLGARTAYLWPLSQDRFGATLRAPLAEAGVDTSLCPRTDRLTTLAFVSLTNGEARYSFYDEGSAGRMFAPDDIPALPDGIGALFIGGISLVPDPCGATIETLARDLGARLPVMLDPNIRPFFIPDPKAYRARLDRLLGLARIVKLSADDRGWLMPGTGAAEAAGRLLAQGAAAVLTTEGAQGATAYLADGTTIRVSARPVTVADTIGAGDTFNAGVLAALAAAGALGPQGWRAPDAGLWRRALELGVQAAAVTVSRAGANPPWRHELPPPA